MVNTGCTLLSSSTMERGEKRAAPLIANWLRYRNNTGESARVTCNSYCAKFVTGFLRLCLFSRKHTHAYRHVHTYIHVFYPPAIEQVCATNGLRDIPHDLLPNLLVLVGALSSRCAPLVFPISPLPLSHPFSLPIFLSLHQERNADRPVKLLHQRSLCAFNYRNIVCVRLHQV